MLKVKTLRRYPYYLQIKFMDFEKNGNHIICEDMVINRLEKMQGHKKIRDMFPEIEKHLLEECNGPEQIRDVEDWFNQDLEALLMPLSYYRI